MSLPAFLRFAGDATPMLVAAVALLVLSGFATWGDLRRVRRTDLDAVGWVPWRDLAAWSSFAGLTLLALGVVGWLRA